MSKFDSATDEWLYGQSADEEEGSSTEGDGWYGLHRGPFTVPFGELNAMDTEFMVNQAGAIIFEHTNGFVDVDYYEDKEDLEKAWDRVLDAHEEPDEEGGDYTTFNRTVFFQYGKRAVTVGDDEDWRAAVKAHMDREEFWPDVWEVSDHGNWQRLKLHQPH